MIIISICPPHAPHCCVETAVRGVTLTGMPPSNQ